MKVICKLKESSEYAVMKVVKYTLGRIHVSQSSWEQLHALSLEGMNIGGGSGVSDSGELWVMDYIGNYLANDKPAIVFDVGANIGSYSSAVISRLGNNIKLYCFEPSKKTFELLASNLTPHENVKLFNFGFGNKEESVMLYSNAEASGLASIYKRRLDHFGIRMAQKEETHLRTMDNFCTDMQIGHINLLKLDVEGNELNVLNGAQSLISSDSIDFIQFEFGGVQHRF